MKSSFYVLEFTRIVKILLLSKLFVSIDYLNCKLFQNMFIIKCLTVSNFLV